MVKKFLLVFALISAIALAPAHDKHKTRPENHAEMPAVAAQLAQEAIEPTKAANAPIQAEAAVKTAPEAPKAPEPAKQTPPQPVNDCGAHSAREVYDLLIANNVPRLAAIQLLGSWKHESGGDFNQCQKRGDGGIAWGLNSWHPARRYDMPHNLAEQVRWAVHVEMPRDCQACYDRFMAAESVWTIRAAIQASTRWGVLGSRWVYADQFAQQF